MLQKHPCPERAEHFGTWTAKLAQITQLQLIIITVQKMKIKGQQSCDLAFTH